MRSVVPQESSSWVLMLLPDRNRVLSLAGLMGNLDKQHSKALFGRTSLLQLMHTAAETLMLPSRSKLGALSRLSQLNRSCFTVEDTSEWL